MLPNLIVIGAAKCGTTSLNEYLDAHPDVTMAPEKELNFFVEEKNWANGVDWYGGRFADAPVRGEASPAYSAYPLYRGVPERIREVVPEVRLVYLVRDPIDRVVSHYLHRSVNWPDMPPLAEALDDDVLHDWLVTPSRYWLQVERYLECFPDEQLLVLDSDDLRERRAETMRRVFAFAGVDPDFDSEQFAASHNRATGQVRRNRSGRAVSRALSRALGPARATALAARAPSALKEPFRTRVERPVVDDALRERLAAELRGDVDRLRAHTGLAFAGWSL